MKILFITGSLNQGGAEYQILQLAKLFQDKGHEIEVFALTDYSFYKYFVDNNNIKYFHLYNYQNRIKRIWLTSRKIKKFQPDLIVSYLKVVGQVTIIARLLSGVKCKVIVGERTADIQPRMDRFHFNLMRLANAITVNSISKLDYLKKNFKRIKNKTYFFPNLLDVSKISFLEKSYANNTLHLGFIGRISREKNILEMIKAVSLLHKKNIPIHFSIYGDSRNVSYLDNVNTLIKKEKLEAAVTLCGKSNEILEVYKKIDLLILISNYEGFSNVISEALASGIPVITSDIPENKYLIEDGINGFVVNHKDVNSIATGIEKFIKLPTDYKKKMGLENRKKAKSIFNQDLVYEKYIDLIESI
ncbi:glycosyltransferase family 4 protein [Namhaeicola litoreus]|uniref:Glycosyltransferase family 4 protein n=1 Tax=Namhaeicola litoreus TaxID=1052145 RepID=A0ABW3Y5S4_9FLAO